MSYAAEPLPDVAEWQAQYLRLIAFPLDPQVSVAQEWWRQLTGSEPESSTRKGRLELHDVGRFEETTLSLDVDFARLQWTVAPRIDVENFPETPPTLGSFVDRGPWFREVIDRWLPNCPTINRVAFASTLLQPVETKEAAYQRLNAYLRSVAINSGWSDLQFRVNRRTQSRVGVENLEVNRLCTWACVRVSMDLRAQVIAPEVLDERRLHHSDSFFCSLELDINTALPRDQLPSDRLSDVFAELMEFGRSIAERGDEELCR